MTEFEKAKLELFATDLAAFTKAAIDLQQTWEKLDHTGAYFATNYPFEKSFDEVVADILEWKEAHRQQ